MPSGAMNKQGTDTVQPEPDSVPDYMSDEVLRAMTALSDSAPSGSSATRKRPRSEEAPSVPLAPLPERMVASLKVGLAQPLSPATSLGYRMLAGMGYSGAGGLGKGAAGRAEPVPIAIPTGRRGIGAESHRRDALRQRIEEVGGGSEGSRPVLDADAFRTAQSRRFSDEAKARQLAAATRICEALDEQRAQREGDGAEDGGKGVDDSAHNGSSEDPLTPAELADAFEAKLAQLQERHNYCFWCAVQFDSGDDLVCHDCAHEAEGDV